MRPPTDEEILHASRGLMLVKRGDGTLSLSWRWFSVRRLVLTAVYLAPMAILLDPDLASVNLMTVIFAGIALWGVYWGATQLFNSTRITVDSDVLRVSHGPVPWPGNKHVPVKDMEQLYVGWQMYRGPYKWSGGKVTYSSGCARR